MGQTKSYSSKWTIKLLIYFIPFVKLGWTSLLDQAHFDSFNGESYLIKKRINLIGQPLNLLILFSIDIIQTKIWGTLIHLNFKSRNNENNYLNYGFNFEIKFFIYTISTFFSA